MPQNKKKTKVYSVQPRYEYGEGANGWAFVEEMFRTGTGAPIYGTVERDLYLVASWQNEPMTAGVFSTWIEKAQTINWRVIGGRNAANSYAQMYHRADGGMGWSHYQGIQGLHYLSADKGPMTELGRLRRGATFGKVLDIQNVDVTRMVRIGKKDHRWRYFPDPSGLYAATPHRKVFPIDYPNQNIIQIVPMPYGRERFAGYGYCAMSRLLDAKELMVGYLMYHRQEIGNLPPELMVIINGLSEEYVRTAFDKYKQQREAKGMEEYSGIWWLGGDDPGNLVTAAVNWLTPPNKSFSFVDMVEWFIKTASLNTGEDVGEYWLIQHSGATKALQTVQAMKARGKGVARFLQEQERQFNTRIMPYGTRFEYDEKDDDQDMQRAEILALRVRTLKEMAEIGVAAGAPTFGLDILIQQAIEWEVIPPGAVGEDAPFIIGAMLKEMASDDVWSVDRNLEIQQVRPWLKGQEQDQAMWLYRMIKDVYGANGRPIDKPLEEPEAIPQ